MPEPSENLAMNQPSGINAPEIDLNSKMSAKEVLLSNVLPTRKDLFFIFVLIILLLKSALFLGIVNNNNLASFNYFKGFYSFQTPPSLLIYSAFLITFMSFSYVFKGRLQFWALSCSNIIISLLMVGDLMYYRGFGSFPSPYLFSQASNLDNLFSSAFSMLRPIDALFFLDIVFLLLISKVIVKYFQTAKRRVLIFFFLFVLSLSAIYYQHYRLDIKGLGDDYLFNVAWVPNQTLTNLSPIGYHLFDLYNHYKDNQQYVLQPQEIEDIKLWLGSKEEKLPNNEYMGIFKGKNLIAIQVESLESFVINQKVDGQEITPNLNRLLKNSYYFPNIYEQVYNGNSSDADLLFNTSLYPVRNGSTFFRFPQNTYNSLPMLMKLDGYNTLGIHPDKGSYWNWMPALNSIGFDKTYDVSHFKQDETIGLGISDGCYLSQVATLLENQKEPFYSFLVTLSSHSPFDLPQKYQQLSLKDSLNTTKLGGYFQSIRYTDQEIGNLLAKLEKSNLMDNTVVVIYGDHTGVHKYYNDEISNISPNEPWWLDDSKRVPLIIYSKDLKSQEFKVTGGQIDLMPTLAYLFDLNDSYKKTAMGRNLLNTQKDFAVLADRKYVGTAASDSEKAFLIKGIDISDLIIRSNYYKTSD